MDAANLCTNLIIGAIFICFFILIIFAVKVRSVQTIIDNPGAFLLEMILIGFIPALLISLILMKTRKADTRKLILTTTTLSLKFMIFHLLFQLSGVYDVAYKRT